MIRKDADYIIERSISAVMPDPAVRRVLEGRVFGPGRVVLVSAGKAGWQMARAAGDVLGDRIDAGVVITKYGHVKGEIQNLQMFEAGHPVPDENSFRGTQAALDLVSPLSGDDTVIFLLSGGGSALFEKPLIEPDELFRLTDELLSGGANIRAINTIRKRMSAVKGGRFAKACAPASVLSIILSDIIGDPLDMIASGPAYPDSSSSEEAISAAEKYHLTLTGRMRELLSADLPQRIDNVQTYVTGSVRELARSAAGAAASLGYRPMILTDTLDCEAAEAGRFLSAIARSHQDTDESLAFIAGGETVVHLRGKGKGGRNQEIALSAAPGISGLRQTAVFSIGSDGTDGPTDAAGGYVDDGTLGEIRSGAKATIQEAESALADNNSYPLLKKTGGLIMTGPTGTNVNDVSVLLIKR